MKLPSDPYKTHWNTTGIARNTSADIANIIYEFLHDAISHFGLYIITSVYYSLRKRNHLQTNHLAMGSKTIYHLL